jgi:hypothetical protein
MNIVLASRFKSQSSVQKTGASMSLRKEQLLNSSLRPGDAGHSCVQNYTRGHRLFSTSKVRLNAYITELELRCIGNAENPNQKKL